MLSFLSEIKQGPWFSRLYEQTELNFLFFITIDLFESIDLANKSNRTDSNVLTALLVAFMLPSYISGCCVTLLTATSIVVHAQKQH